MTALTAPEVAVSTAQELGFFVTKRHAGAPCGLPAQQEVAQGEQDHRRDHAEEAAVEAHAALPDREDFERMGEVVARLVEQHLAEAAAEKTQTSPTARKIGDFYAAYMDTTAIEGKGIAPLKPQLDSIAAIGDKTALAAAIGRRKMGKKRFQHMAVMGRERA